jgi:hypothetical protein
VSYRDEQDDYAAERGETKRDIAWGNAAIDDRDEGDIEMEHYRAQARLELAREASR